MEPYAIVFCLLASLAIVELYSGHRKNEAIIAAACVLILTVFSGIRWETGNDWANYIDHYRLTNSLEYQDSEFELGYRALVFATRSLGLDYTAFLLISALISNSAYVYVSSRLGPVAVLTLLFFSSFYLGYMGTQRQTLAGAFACLGMIAIYDRRCVAGAALIGLGTLFHVSAIVCLAALVVPRRSVSPVLLTVAGSVLALIALASGPMVQWLIEGTLTNGFVVGKVLSYVVKEGADVAAPANLVLAAVKRVVLGIIFVVLCRQRGESLGNYVLNLYLLSIAMFFLFVGISPILALRIGLYFTFFENFLFYTSILTLGGRYWREAVAVIGFSVSMVRLYWSVVAYEPELYLPYKTMFTYSDHRRFVQ